MYWTLVKIGLIRKRLRTFLTIMSMFIAFVLYGSLNTLSGLFTGAVQGLSADNIIVMPRYDMFGKLPYSHINYIKNLDGVEDIMYMDFLISDSIESMMDGVVYASSPNIFEVYDRFEASQESKDALRNNPNAVIVGKLMAEQKGLRVGDILNTESNSLNSDGTNNWSFEIVGFYTAKQIKGDEMGAIINWETFDEARVNQKGTVGMIMVNTSSAEMGDSISSQIDQRFMNSPYATRSGPESMIAVEMAGEIADVELIVNSILLSVFFTILLVSSNTLAQSIRERTSDIGVLKCLGYKDLTIFSSVILEAITICLTAVIAGLVVTLSLVPLMESMSDGMLEDTISVTPSVIIGGFFIGIIIAFMSAAVPAYQALRLKVVDALREG
ncbi:MAG: FtsX-like permease family protein [SAR86 cluster bacterium]|jgi:putative ABC transport system permease protein|nr:FtsX-like permease family protein [SAR86 cluster bacterium]|tara:strand:- start:392 stop:1543 length:1152 start_codon:yes stop_codon:yes gene_type:complete